MKCGDFGGLLKEFANVLDTAGAPVARDQIAMLAAVFDAHPTARVSGLAKRIAALPRAEMTGSPSVGDVARLLSGLKGLLDKKAKTAILADINAIEQVLDDRASMDLHTFARIAAEAAATRRPTRERGAPAVRDDLVVHYKEKLEAALGDEEKFAATYNDFCANIAVGKPEIMALAKQMTGGSARTEDAASKKIWNRHRSLVVFEAKARATGGRSAA
jgi:hypothetical protein